MIEQFEQAKERSMALLEDGYWQIYSECCQIEAETFRERVKQSIANGDIESVRTLIESKFSWEE